MEQRDKWQSMTGKECELALEKDPVNNYARFRLAELHVTSGQNIDTARKLIATIRATNKKFMKAECFELLGDIENLESIKNYEEAIKFYVKSAQKKPQQTHIYIKLAKTHEKLREFDEAINYVKKVLRRDPKNFPGQYRLGIIQIRNNQK